MGYSAVSAHRLECSLQSCLASHAQAEVELTLAIGAAHETHADWATCKADSV